MPSEEDPTSAQTSYDTENAPLTPQGVVRRTVSRLTILWLFIGIASLGLMTALERTTASADAATRKQEKGPSATEFHEATTGEYEVRWALALTAVHDIGKNGTAGAKEFSEFAPGDSVHSAINKAIQSYQKMLPIPATPNIARRLLILEHLAGRKLDETLLTKELSGDLRATGGKSEQKVSEDEIKAEIRLWRSLYGNGSVPVASDAERIRKMNLRLLGTQALIDLYERQKDNVNAEKELLKRNQASVSFLLFVTIGSFISVVAFVLGIGVFVYTIQAIARRRIDLIGEVQPQAPRFHFYDFIDVFAFYFAAFEFSRVFFSLGLSMVAGENRHQLAAIGNSSFVIVLELFVYLLPHIAAAIYLAQAVRRCNADWQEVGVTKASFFANIGYGVLGYCGALPLMWILSLISERIFRNNPDVTPNPAMGLIASKEDAVGRILLFIMISIAAPLCEELFFRGVLLGALRRRYGMIFSILLSSLAFALGHPIQDWLPILGLGIAFGIMRDTRQSLVPSITAHFLQNSMTYIYLSMLFGGN